MRKPKEKVSNKAVKESEGINSKAVSIKSNTEKNTHITNEGVELKYSKKLYPDYIGKNIDSTSRYKRILKDLYNYAARRGGVKEGFRTNFCLIYATFFRKSNKSIEEAKAAIRDLVDIEFFKTEGIAVIESVYMREDILKFKNKTIAETLCFD